MRSESSAVSTALRVGVAISFLLIVLGLVAALVSSPQSGPITPRQLFEVPRNLAAFDAVSLIHVGILALLLTPFARVVVLVFQFARQRDASFAAVSFGVLLLLITTILIGLFWEAR